MKAQLKLIAAVCENGGIGKNGDLPWRLKKEMAYFTKMTSKTREEGKQNAVIMGRRTWDCIPAKYRPLPKRLNVVLSRSDLDLGSEALVYKSLEDAVQGLKQRNDIENLWIIGGSSIYQIGMSSPDCYRVYLTRVNKSFDCDTFFPELPASFSEVEDEDVPKGIQEENGITYEFKVYQKM